MKNNTSGTSHFAERVFQPSENVATEKLNIDFAIIIPAKNEQNNIGFTLDSLARQTHKPTVVLVTDNGSTDRTPEIIKEYSQKYDFIRYFYFPSDNTYSLGGKIVRIFNAGKAHLEELGIDYDYLVKMDSDVGLDKRVFEKLADHLKSGNYGIVSPLAYITEGERIIYASSPDWHTLGDFKVYKKECLDNIGGLKEDLGWDCADNISAIEKGYITTIFKDVFYRQHRPIGRYSLLTGRKRQGLGAYKLRYSFLYLLMKTFHDIFKPPYVAGSIYYLWGYFSGLMRNLPKTHTPAQGKLFRKLLWTSFFDRLRQRNFYLTQFNGNNKKPTLETQA